MTCANRDLKVEIRTTPIAEEARAELIIRALFGCSPAEAAKMCMDELHAAAKGNEVSA